MIKLDERLTAVAEMIGTCDVFADIGSDHGYLPIYLLQAKKIKKAIITDINKGPLQSGIQNAALNGVSEFCDFRLGGGLKPLSPNKCDVIAICGMGGDTIANMLTSDIVLAYQVEKLVLQPMTNQIYLRKYLTESGFSIIDENMVRDRHLFYQIITAQKGDMNVNYDTEYDFEFPKSLMNKKDPIFYEFLKFKLIIEERIKEKILLAEAETNQLKNTIDKIGYIKELLKYYES